MLVIGAGGHAKEVLELLSLKDFGKLCFYDDVSSGGETLVFSKYPLLRCYEQARKLFLFDSRFIIAVGAPMLRSMLAAQFRLLGGDLTSIISESAIIGSYDVEIMKGVNIMQGVFISNSVKVGEGTLINTRAIINHDVIIGDYCEVGPAVVLTGGVQIGDFTSIGANATVLPRVKVGENAIIGAGAVVTIDVPDGCVVAGVPAKIIRKKGREDGII